MRVNKSGVTTLFAWIMMVVGLGGCHDPLTKEFLRMEKEMAPRYRGLGIEDNIRTCIKLHNNSQIDCMPVVIASNIATGVRDSKKIVLRMYDEEKDIMGFGVLRRGNGGDGRVVVSDHRYPIYSHFKMPYEYEFRLFTIDITQESGDESRRLWDEYTRNAALADEPLSKTQWKETLPNICIPLMLDSTSEFLIYVYDAKGNKSNCTPLVDRNWPYNEDQVSNLLNTTKRSKGRPKGRP